MTFPLSRRRVLASGAAIVAAAAIRPVLARAVVTEPIRLTVVRRVLDVNGKASSVYGIRQGDGTAGLSLDPGQRFLVDLENHIGEDTIVHWHGQTPPVVQDGVALTGLEPLIGPGTDQGYDYAPRSGTYWMHSHQGLQEQLLLAAPLVVRTAEDVRSDAQEITIMLHDFSFREPTEILAGLTHRAAMTTMSSGTATKAAHAMKDQPAAHGVGGNGSMGMPGMDMGARSMSGMTNHPMVMKGHPATATVATASGTGTPKTGMSLDLNDVDFDAYLANDRTLADPRVVRSERRGRVRLRLINGAVATAFWIDLGTLDGTIVAVDGDPVQPIVARRFPMAEAQRIDVMLELPAGGGVYPVLAQREGDRQRTGVILVSSGAAIGRISSMAEAAVGPADMSLERQLRAAQPLYRRAADITHRVTLDGSMSPYIWTLNGRTWADHIPLRVVKGQRVALELVNQSAMAHPMHLHGHHFQVEALNGSPLNGAMRDTVLVPANGSVRIAFDADNPGRWLFHCHNLYHMATGMITEVVYKDFA